MVSLGFSVAMSVSKRAMIAIIVAIPMSIVAMIVSRGPRPSCNQCGYEARMIATIGPDDCEQLQVVVTAEARAWRTQRARDAVLNECWRGAGGDGRAALGRQSRNGR